jgi:hypothetical protein
MSQVKQPLTVNAVARVPVVVQSVCEVVEVGEDPSIGASWPTTDFLVSGSLGDNQRQKKAGTTYPFVKRRPFCFRPNDIAGYVQLPSGSTSFFQDEHDASA